MGGIITWVLAFYEIGKVEFSSWLHFIVFPPFVRKLNIWSGRDFLHSVFFNAFVLLPEPPTVEGTRGLGASLCHHHYPQYILALSINLFKCLLILSCTHTKEALPSRLIKPLATFPTVSSSFWALSLFMELVSLHNTDQYYHLEAKKMMSPREPEDQKPVPLSFKPNTAVTVAESLSSESRKVKDSEAEATVWSGAVSF